MRLGQGHYPEESETGLNSSGLRSRSHVCEVGTMFQLPYSGTFVSQAFKEELSPIIPRVVSHPGTGAPSIVSIETGTLEH